MKMVSAAKYAQAERRLKPARAYGGGCIDVYDKTGAEGPEDVTRQLIIAISSDRGLCGGIHSGINKAIKGYIANTPANVETKMFLVGDKCTGVIKKVAPDSIETQVKDYGRRPPTFDDASAVAQAILECGFEFDRESCSTISLGLLYRTTCPSRQFSAMLTSPLQRAPTSTIPSTPTSFSLAPSSNSLPSFTLP